MYRHPLLNWNKHVTHNRAKEIEAIKSILEEINDGATSRIVAITGPSGIGKSVLVTEGIYPTTGGYVASGKFDQFLPQTPYAAVLRCLRSLFQTFFFNLNTPSKRRASYASELVELVGPNREVICAAIPEINSLFPQTGSPSRSPNLALHSDAISLSDTRNRFHSIFLGILAMITRESMVTLFIDDVQWADSASIDLIASIVEGQRRKLLVIVTSREPVLPTALTTIPLTITFALTPFTVENVAEFIHKMLSITTDAVQALAVELHARTAGNPFFVSQLLRQAVAQGIVAYDSRTSEWCIDVVRIPQLSIASDVVEFLLANLALLPPSVSEVLRVAACIGSTFNSDILAQVLARMEGDTRGLHLAEHEGLVIRQPATDSGAVVYRFSHDRVMQASHSKNSEEQIQQIHLVAGEVLSLRGKDLYEIADHFAKALPIIPPDKYMSLCERFLTAAKNAKLAAAFDSASRYAQVGLKVLRKKHQYWKDAWTDDYQFTYPLSVLVMECSFNYGDLTASEKYYQDILQHATQEGTVLAASARVILLVNASRFADAIELGCEAMNKLTIPGVSLPRHPTKEELGTVFTEIDRLLCGTPADTLESLPALSHPLVSIAITLLVSISTASYFFDATLFAYSSSLIVQLTLQHGITPQASPGLGIYGLLCSSILEDYKRAFEVGECALRISNKYGILTYQGQVHFLFSCLISFYQNHIRENLPLQRRALILCTQAGNTLFSAFCAVHIPMTRLWTGDALEDVVTESQHTMASLGEQCRFADGYPMTSSTLYCCKMLLGIPCQQDLEDSRVHVSPFGSTWAATLRVKAHTLLHKYDDVLEDVNNECQKIFDDLKGQMHICMYFFYYSLTLASLYYIANPSTTTNESSHYIDKIVENRTTLRRWAACSKVNCEHQCMLIEAELAHIGHRNDEALQLFENASRLATEREFYHHNAIILERMALFLARIGEADRARDTLVRSIDAYVRWGACAVVAVLVAEHLDLLQVRTLVPLDPIPRKPLAASGTNIDVAAVLECSSVVCESTNLGKMLTNYLSRIISYFKATYGCVILTRSDGIYYAHSCWSRNQTGVPCASLLCPPVLVPYTFENVASLPCSPRALRSAVMLKRTIVVSDLPASGIYTDAYFKLPQLANARSLVCMPLMLHGNALGAVYLENDTTHTFDNGNLQTFQLMSAQAAIAIENSRLVENEKAARAEVEAAIGEKDALLQEMQASKLRYQMLAQGIPQLVWSAKADGNVEWANEQFLSYTGSSTLGDVWSAYVHEEDLPHVRAAWDAASFPGGSFSAELRLRDSFGNYQWFLTRGLPAHDSKGKTIRWFGTCTNVDAQKRALEESARLAQVEISERHYRTLAEALPQLVWTSLPDGRVNYYNGKWKEFSGVSLTEGVVMGWLSLVHPEDLEACRKRVKRAMYKCKGFEVECRLRRHDGQFRWHLVRAVRLKDNAECPTPIHAPSPVNSNCDSPLDEIDETEQRLDEGYYYFGTGTDIDDQKKAEVSLIDARKAAERMAEMKSQWVANMSHELRTPSNGILGMLDLLMDTPLTPEQKDYVATMRRSTNVLLTVISDILDFRRNETKQVKLQVEPFSVQSVMEDVCEILYPLAAAKNVDLVHIVSPDVPRMLMGDAARLRQVLVNLINNSIKFSHDGGGHVEVTCHLTTKEHNDSILIPSHSYADIDARDNLSLSSTSSHSPPTPVSPLSSQESSPNISPRFSGLLIGYSDESLPKNLSSLPPIFPSHAPLAAAPTTRDSLTVRIPTTTRKPSSTPQSSHNPPESVWLKFQVTDSGVGIPKEQQAMLFEPFFQVDSSATRKHGGTGLGLAISRQIVAALGGRIWVQSDEGCGSTFVFTSSFPPPPLHPLTTSSTFSSASSSASSSSSSSSGSASAPSVSKLDLQRLQNASPPTRFYSPGPVAPLSDSVPALFLPQQIIVYSDFKGANMRIVQTYLANLIPCPNPYRSPIYVASTTAELPTLISDALSRPITSPAPSPYVACVVELLDIPSINALISSLTSFTSRRDVICRLVIITIPHLRAQITLPATPTTSQPPIVFLMKPISETKLRISLSIAPSLPSPPIKLSPRISSSIVPVHSPSFPHPSPVFSQSSLLPSPTTPSAHAPPRTPPPLRLSASSTTDDSEKSRRALCVEGILTITEGKRRKNSE